MDGQLFKRPSENRSQIGIAKGECVNRLIDLVLSFSLLSILSPIFAFNFVSSLMLRKPLLKKVIKRDPYNNFHTLMIFNCGVFKTSGLCFSVLRGEAAFFGLPSKEEASTVDYVPTAHEGKKIGLFNGVSLHALTGLETNETSKDLNQQLARYGIPYVALIMRSLLAQVIYRKGVQGINQPKQFSLFGINIFNATMREAIDWILLANIHRNTQRACKVACFVNVNSVNLSAEKPALTDALNQADACFADGSGMRLAAKHLGIQIKANVNGTDLMPLLCEQMEQQKKSLYLLGSEPGVAQKAAEELIKAYPKLKIVGIRHGYFNPTENQTEIELINRSEPDVLLVAMGSPVQEQWLVQHANALNCGTALAVGGLLDFLAAKYSRAPLWMRELGMEWIWRLFQDPKTKFKRYVIGNPVFLFRTYFTHTIKRGF